MATRQLLLNRKRNLGDVISDGFVFAKRNFNVIGSLFLLLVLPVMLVGIFNIYYVFQGANFISSEPSGPFGNFGGVEFILGYGFSMLGILIFYYINYATAICYVRNNNEAPDRAMVVQFMKDHALKYLAFTGLVLLVMVVLSGIMFGTVLISPALMVITMLLVLCVLVYLFPILSIFPLLYMDKDLDFFTSLQEVFRMIKGEWWPTFGAIFITNLIGSFASYVLIIPVYIIMLVQMFGSVEDGTVSDGVNFWMSILMIVSILASTIILIYTIGAISLKYFDLKERKDHTSLIDRIDSIGNNEQSMFENEGEF